MVDFDELRLDLHLLGAGVETSARAHDPVRLRVDRQISVAGGDRLRQVLPERRAAVAPAAGALEEPLRADGPERSDHEDRRVHERMDRERVELSRSERDHSGHQVRPAHREHLREVAAAALADDRHLLTARLGHRLEPLLEALHGIGRAGHVEAHPGLARVMSGAAEPARHQAKGIVAGEEARDQQDGLTAGVRDPIAVPDRVPQQCGGLQAQSALPPDGGQGKK